MKFKPKSISALEIEDAASDGSGVGRDGERVIFVEGAVPGDVADVTVYRKQKKRFLARIDRLVSASPERTEPPCRHFEVCGGCKWQHLSYEGQLRFKQKQVSDAFARLGKFDFPEIRPIIGAEKPYHYRNKLDFSFSSKRWLSQTEIATGETFEQNALGFHVPKYFDKVVQIDECLLHRPDINDIRNEVRRFALENDYTFHDAKAHEGFLRNLIFRVSEAEDKIMLVLIVNENDEASVARVFERLEPKFPQISSFVWIHNPKWNDSYADLDYKVWKGPGFLTEKLGAYSYHIGPKSFFQTNTRQAGRLYDVVREFVAAPVELLYDLYCGAGTIGIYLSELAEKVVGLEYVEDAVRDAETNLQLNGLENFRFYAGDMAKTLTPELVSQAGRPDCLVTDPPRAGMEPKVVERLLEIAAPRIVYVSCNPATQARDIANLARVYEVKAVQPMDMFPQTGHVENVALLERKDAAD